MHLAHNGKTVPLVASLVFGVASGSGAEIGELEVDAVEGCAVSQDFQGATFLDQAGDMANQGFAG